MQSSEFHFCVDMAVILIYYRTSYPTQQPILNDRHALIFENAKDENSMHQLLSHGIPFIVNGIKM